MSVREEPATLEDVSLEDDADEKPATTFKRTEDVDHDDEFSEPRHIDTALLDELESAVDYNGDEKTEKTVDYNGDSLVNPDEDYNDTMEERPASLRFLCVLSMEGNVELVVEEGGGGAAG